MTSPSGPARTTDPPTRVSTLELFFDLVFVFTIAQLTSALAENVSWVEFGRGLLSSACRGGCTAPTPGSGATLSGGPALALAGGVTLFLAGDVWLRQVLSLVSRASAGR